jgi:hypothetical protein
MLVVVTEDQISSAARIARSAERVSPFVAAGMIVRGPQTGSCQAPQRKSALWHQA